MIQKYNLLASFDSLTEFDVKNAIDFNLKENNRFAQWFLDQNFIAVDCEYFPTPSYWHQDHNLITPEFVISSLSFVAYNGTVIHTSSAMVDFNDQQWIKNYNLWRSEQREMLKNRVVIGHTLFKDLSVIFFQNFIIILRCWDSIKKSMS